MKKLLLFSILMISLSLEGQENFNKLFLKYDSINEGFKQHKDTALINTWLNLMITNSYLQQLSRTDSMIKNVLKKDSPSDTLIGRLKNYLDLEKSAKAGLLSKLESTQHEIKFFKNLTYFSLSMAAIFLIFLLILISLHKSVVKDKSQKETELRKYYTELKVAGSEIEEALKTQNLLASEINRIKSEFQEEIEAFGKVNRDLEDEKLMLENQIIEVKKAWESEVMKRKEFENYDKNNIPSEASKVNDELVEQLSARLNQRDIELQEMKMKLEKNESNDKILLQLKSRIDRLNRDLKLENEARNVAEKELVLLIEKINEISKSYSS